ncbi:MAG: hypothetical protein ABI640_20670 [Gammaproteobacteria bacterium]
MKNPTLDTSRDRARALMRPRWKGANSIQLAHQLNERCVELISELAGNVAINEALPTAVRENRDLWPGLSVDARRRLAALPFVIVDVRFRDEQWWRALGQAPSPTELRAECLPSDCCQDLLLETLMFAWQVAREDSHVAQMIFAMTRPVARIIAALAIREIRALAIEQRPCLRIRWSDNARFWREFLVRVRGEDAIALEDAMLNAKLLFCGELIDQPRGDT